MTKPAENPEPSAGRVGTLRGAPVDVDLHLVGRVAAFLGVLVLAFSVIVLFLAGAHRNAQLNLLRQRGVPVTMTVTNCLELLGGSGSNGAGYSCR
ncbi:MAG TPA: hypothetical protein VK386_03975, partial [Acidimicrobiales bacterium]|nr:hypothetical protein [Acidimicrobiales bacterium]